MIEFLELVNRHDYRLHTCSFRWNCKISAAYSETVVFIFIFFPHTRSPKRMNVFVTRDFSFQLLCRRPPKSMASSLPINMPLRWLFYTRTPYVTAVVRPDHLTFILTTNTSLSCGDRVISQLLISVRTGVRFRMLTLCQMLTNSLLHAESKPPLTIDFPSWNSFAIKFNIFLVFCVLIRHAIQKNMYPIRIRKTSLNIQN